MTIPDPRHSARTTGPTADEMLLESAVVPERPDALRKTDPWRVLRIMGEFVEGFEKLGDVQDAVAGLDVGGLDEQLGGEDDAAGDVGEVAAGPGGLLLGLDLGEGGLGGGEGGHGGSFPAWAVAPGMRTTRAGGPWRAWGAAAGILRRVHPGPSWSDG